MSGTSGTSGTSEYLLYDSKIKMTFSHGGHRYHISNKIGEGWSKPKPTTGVTTILNVMNKPALVNWASRLSAERYAREVKQLLKDKKDISVNILNELIGVSKNAPNENRDKAGDLGTAIHQHIEAFHDETVAVDPLEKEDLEIVELALKGYIEDWTSSGNTIKLLEQPIYSRAFDYAGTLDQLIETPSKKKVLRDVKTSKVSKWAPQGAYVEMFAQLGGYAQALKEMYDWLPDSLEIINVGKDGIIRKTTNEDFGMTVNDALHYWNSIYSTWYTNKDWEFKFKRS